MEDHLKLLFLWGLRSNYEFRGSALHTYFTFFSILLSWKVEESRAVLVFLKGRPSTYWRWCWW